jgi:tRNA G10  N-methylase Trm11
LPYVLPHPIKTGSLYFVLAFGDLSYFEICTVMSNDLTEPKQLWTDIATAGFKEQQAPAYQKLAGVHKVVAGVTPRPLSWSGAIEKFEDYLDSFEEGFNFSLSLYTRQDLSKADYDERVSELLAILRAAGHRKAKLIRPKLGNEVHAKDIVSRKIVDFVVIQSDDGFRSGITSFVPETKQFQIRSNERPVISSDISMSSRLAKVLLNVSGVHKGETVLDPFCGSGTILLEALLAGVRCIGIDRDPVRIRNATRNVEWLSKEQHMTEQLYSLKVGDATKLEAIMAGTTVDAVVSEPIFLPKIEYTPSLDKARKLIRNSSRLYSESLYSIAKIVKKGGLVVLVVPSLRTAAGRDVSVIFENVEEVGLRPFQTTIHHFEFPIRISNERTRWVRRLIYVLERV